LKTDNNGLIPHWVLLWATALSLVIYLIIAHTSGPDLQQNFPDSQRVIIRTLFYALTILGFPVTNLLRHIQLRLNQTMPGGKPAKDRYLSTVIVSLLFAESVGIFGLIMFILGDDFNSLYIFTMLAALALYLYRPKASEYISIASAITEAQQGTSRQN
jgi:hypothetical protein